MRTEAATFIKEEIFPNCMGTLDSYRSSGTVRRATEQVLNVPPEVADRYWRIVSKIEVGAPLVDYREL